jgi:hypothetical protein
MLVAAAAFLLQSLAIAGAQIAATTGFLPEPAVAFSENVHFHGAMAVHVHNDGADAIAGHVHDPNAPVDGDNGGLVDAACWTLFCPSLAVAALNGWASPSRIASRLDLLLADTASGIVPPGLVRPPSTPSIA